MLYRKQYFEMEDNFMSDFTTKLISELERLTAGTETVIQTNQVTKPNNIDRTAICIKQADSNLGINYYLDDLMAKHEAGQTVEDIAKDILHHSSNDTTFKNSSILTSIISNISSYENIKDSIFIRLLNLKGSGKYLDDKIFFPFIENGDTYELAICPCIRIPANDDSIGTIAITQQLRSRWNISDDELLKNAIECTKKTYGYKFQNIFDVISTLISENDSFSEYMNPPEPNIYVFSNTISCNGAATMLFNDELREFADRLGYDLFIIPSSIHETLIIPDDGSVNPSSVQDMILEVNRNEVQPDEILSNHLFYYSRSTNKVTIVNTTAVED